MSQNTREIEEKNKIKRLSSFGKGPILQIKHNFLLICLMNKYHIICKPCFSSHYTKRIYYIKQNLQK